MCGTDYHAYDGNQNFFTYPRVLGHELGVTVVSFGDDETAAASGLKVDDKCAVVPYWECGKCVSCKWGKPNCCTDISVIGNISPHPPHLLLLAHEDLGNNLSLTLTLALALALALIHSLML